MKRVGCGHAGPKSTAWISCAPVCLRGGCEGIDANYKLPDVQSSSIFEKCPYVVFLILYSVTLSRLHTLITHGWLQSWTRNCNWQQCKARQSLYLLDETTRNHENNSKHCKFQGTNCIIQQPGYETKEPVMSGSRAPNTEDAAQHKGHMIHKNPGWPVYCSMYKKSLKFSGLVESRKLYWKIWYYMSSVQQKYVRICLLPSNCTSVG